MTDDPKQKEQTKPKKEFDDILRHVDSLAVPRPRSTDEMTGYDKDGLPIEAERAKLPDFKVRAKEILGDRVFEDFLKYRHREWEESLCEETKPTGAEGLLNGKK
jgi:glutamine synthetase